MELKINDYQLPEVIKFNYEELKQELQEKVSHYETLVYTDDQIKEAKTDKANLNKLKKALNDERIRREREYLEPFNDFKSKINEIISIIDKPVQVIDKQVKEFEDKQKQEKLEVIKDLWESLGTPEHLVLEKIFDSKWLNASVSMKSIQEAITIAIEKFNQDMDTLSKLPEFGFEAQQVYISTLDINKAICEGQRLSEIQKKKAEYEAEQAKLKKEAEFAQTMNPPVEEVALTEEVVVSPAEPVKQWVSFKCLLSVEDAQALGQFFNDRNISYEQI